MAADKKRESQKTTLNPLTFDEALAGLLATEPPSEKQKAQRKAARATRAKQPKSKQPKSKKHEGER